MEVKAIAKNIRVSPEKMLLIAAKVKKMPPKEATEVLDFLPQKGSLPLKKVILSAIANARNNFGLEEGTLTFKEIRISKGVTFKRYRPIARGQSHPILKKTAHLVVILQGETKKAQGPVAQDQKEATPKDPKETDNGTKS